MVIINLSFSRKIVLLCKIWRMKTKEEMKEEHPKLNNTYMQQMLVELIIKGINKMLYH